MNVIRVNTKEIRLSGEEMATLRKAANILDSFNDETNGNTIAGEIHDLLSDFLDEDVPDGVYRVDLEDDEF